MLRVLGAVVLTAIAVLALAVGGAWTLLQTRWGGDVVRRYAMKQINGGIAGRVHVDRLALSGMHLTLAGVEVRDPQGHPALTVERAEISVSLPALLRGRVKMPSVALLRPHVYLIEGSEGLGIGRAFHGRRAPLPPPTEGAAKPRTIEIDNLTLSGAAVEYSDDLRHLHARLDDLNAAGTLRMADVLALSANITGPSLNLSGQWKLELRPGKSGSDLHARLEAAPPGARVSAQATILPERIDLAATVEASDLAATGDAIGEIIGKKLDLAGRGRLKVTMAGPPEALALRMTAEAPSLGWENVRARDLRARAFVPNLRAPDALDLEVSASSGRVGDRSLIAPAVSIQSVGTRVSAHLRVRELAQHAPSRASRSRDRRSQEPRSQEPRSIDLGAIDLSLAGRRERGLAPALAMTVDHLDLTYPGGRWTLSHPGRVRVGGDELAVSGLALANGAQRVEVNVDRRPRGLAGRVAVTSLDLAQLAPLLGPTAPAVGGRLNANVRLEPQGRSPIVHATASLAGGRIGRLRGLELSIDGHATGGRARGHLTAKAVGVDAEGQFDLPARWPLGKGRTPLDADLQLTATDLAVSGPAAAAALGAPLPALRGRLRLRAHVEGTAAAPRLALDADAHNLAVANQTLGDLELAVRADGSEPVDLRLTDKGFGGSPQARANLTVHGPTSLRDLLAGPITPARLTAGDVRAEAEANGLPLALVAHYAPKFPATHGTLSSRISLSGNARDPEAKATVHIVGASGDAFPPTEADVELDLAHQQTSTQLRVSRQGHPLVEARARIDTGWRGLMDVSTRAAAPLDLRATLGPVTARRSGLPTGRGGAETGILRASLGANLTIVGTARAPRVTLQADAGDIRLDQASLGSAHLDGKYSDGRATVEAKLASGNGGSVHGHLGTELDLGGLAVGHGLALAASPFQLDVGATNFDLQVLSGIVPEVRSVSGSFNASITGQGTFASPRLNGRLEWRNGAITVSGYGQFREVHLALHGDQQRITLDDLTAKSGDGTAHLSGSAERTSDGYQLAAQSQVSRFLLYQEGQPLARLSVDGSLSGTAKPGHTEIGLDIKDAHVDLPDGQRRDLQPLTLPRDVVMVENGAPNGRPEAEKLHALAARLAGVASPSPAPTRRRESSRAAVVVTLRTARRIWVNGKDAKLELAVEPGMRIAIGEHAHLFGTITVRRGQVHVLGRRFDVRADSTLRWNGPADRPQLDVEAQYDNTNEDVSVIITVKGAPGAMNVSVRSPNRPDLTTSQLYALIISGHLDDGVGRGGNQAFSATSEAASLLGGLIAAGLQSTLAGKLPLDVLTIESGGGTSLTGTQVEAGRYMTDKLYVGYVGRIGADPTRYQNRNAVRAEYRLTGRWQLEGEYGDVGTGTADAVWKKNY